MQTIVLVVHVFLAIGVIGLVLIQHGKGADAGAAFGSGAGASTSVFGSRGSGSFLTRMTTVFALLFFATSMTLFFLASQRTSTLGSVTDNLNLPAIDNSEPAQSTDAPAGESDLPPTPGATDDSESDLPKVDNQ